MWVLKRVVCGTGERVREKINGKCVKDKKREHSSHRTCTNDDSMTLFFLLPVTSQPTVDMTISL